MSNIENYVGNSTLNFLPFLILGFFVVVAGLFGYMVGKRSAFFFTVISIVTFFVSLVITIFASRFFVEKALPNKMWGIDFTIVSSNEMLLKDCLFFLISLALAAIMIVISFVSYIAFFKKKLRSKMNMIWEDKVALKYYRLSGGTTSIVGIFPWVVSIAAYFSVFSGHGANDVFSKTLTLITGWQLQDIKGNLIDISKLHTAMDTFGDRDAKGMLAALLGAKNGIQPNGLTEAMQNPNIREALNFVVSSRIVHTNAEVLTSVLTETELKSIVLTSSTAPVTWVTKIPTNETVVVLKKDLSEFANALTKVLGKSQATPAGIIHFYEVTNLLKTK